MDHWLQIIAPEIGASSLRLEARLQALWRGYGDLLRVRATGAPFETAIIKWVRPPAVANSADALSHARKCRSYDVEIAFYQRFAPRCRGACRVPKLLYATRSDVERILVLEDLDAAGFVLRRRAPAPPEIDRCLQFLAAMHAEFMGEPPNDLWECGTYWHLATRSDELAALSPGDQLLRDAAPIIEARLSSAAHQTIVHGDAKTANFCFSKGAGAVAAVDFQYAGGGSGIKDVAYFLSSCTRSGEQLFESGHLDIYFAALNIELRARGVATSTIDDIESEGRALFPLACVDFFRFLAGWDRRWWQSPASAHERAFVSDVLRRL